MTAEARVVVDASVAVKWLVREELRPQAMFVVANYRQPLAPAFILIEVANTLVKKVRRGEMEPASASHCTGEIAGLVSLRGDGALLAAASDIALRYNRSVYDALYVALALQEGCRLVTADERLVNALRPAFPETLLWLGDLPAA